MFLYCHPWFPKKVALKKSRDANDSIISLQLYCHGMHFLFLYMKLVVIIKVITFPHWQISSTAYRDRQTTGLNGGWTANALKCICFSNGLRHFFSGKCHRRTLSRPTGCQDVSSARPSLSAAAAVSWARCWWRSCWGAVRDSTESTCLLGRRRARMPRSGWRKTYSEIP